MKQGIFFAIIMVVIAIFILNSYSLIDQENVEVYIDNDLIYNHKLTDQQMIVWVVQDQEEFIVLEDQEIVDYFDLNIEYQDLSDPDQIPYDQLDNDLQFNMLVLENKMVTMYEANCQNKICVEVGSITNSYQNISCVPHHLMVKITGESEYV